MALMCLRQSLTNVGAVRLGVLAANIDGAHLVQVDLPDLYIRLCQQLSDLLLIAERRHRRFGQHHIELDTKVLLGVGGGVRGGGLQHASDAFAMGPLVLARTTRFLSRFLSTDAGAKDVWGSDLHRATLRWQHRAISYGQPVPQTHPEVNVA